MMFNTLTIFLILILIISIYISSRINESENKEPMSINLIFNGHHEDDEEVEEFLVNEQEEKRKGDEKINC